MTTQPTLVEPLPQHRFDEAALDRYLEAHVEGYRGPSRIRQFQGGQSNPTFLVEAASGTYVLRKKPPGKLLASAHMIEREFRVQKALEGSPVPVARMLVLCEDADIVGTPFYLMSHVAGRIIATADLPGLTPPERRALYASLDRDARLAASGRLARSGP